MRASMSEAIVDLFKGLWGVWTEMFSAVFEVLPKLLRFLVWALCGVLILPCVYVAGNLFPKWTEWGEEF